MKSILKSGFTLIELLVVITIIGILATGAVTVYTSQIQKARDSTRTTDIKALQGAVEQYYGDKGEYPSTYDYGGTTASGFSGVTLYVQMPSDPKSGQLRVSAAFDYLYNSGQDANNIPFQVYELSTTFEQQANIDSKAKGADGGNDDARLELGIDLKGAAKTTVTGKIDTGVKFGDCVAETGGAAGPACGLANPMVIRKK